MTIEQIRKFRNAEPFRPFHLYLSDGRKLLVTHPEKIGWSANGQSLGVYTRGDSGAMLDVDAIIKIEVAPRRTSRKGNK